MPKKKGDKGGNPNPVQTEKFLAVINTRNYDMPPDVVLAKSPIAAKLPVDYDAKIRALPDKERIAWVRRVLMEAVDREL